MAYSRDLREKVVGTYRTGTFTQSELAEHYSISLSTIKRYLKQYRETGMVSVETHKITGRPRLIEEDGLKTIETLIRENPSITLAELSDKYFKIHRCIAGRSVLSRACHQLKLHRKKLSRYAQEREREDVKKKDTPISKK